MTMPVTKRLESFFIPDVRESSIATIDLIKELVLVGDVRISEHGWDELEADDISVRDIVAGVEGAIEVEDYPDFWKGPSVLVLQYDRDSDPVHVVWGISKGHSAPAVLVTAYRPDPSRWNEDFTERKI